MSILEETDDSYLDESVVSSENDAGSFIYDLEPESKNKEIDEDIWTEILQDQRFSNRQKGGRYVIQNRQLDTLSSSSSSTSSSSFSPSSSSSSSSSFSSSKCSESRAEEIEKDEEESCGSILELLHETPIEIQTNLIDVHQIDDQQSECKIRNDEDDNVDDSSDESDGDDGGGMLGYTERTLQIGGILTQAKLIHMRMQNLKVATDVSIKSQPFEIRSDLDGMMIYDDEFESMMTRLESESNVAFLSYYWTMCERSMVFLRSVYFNPLYRHDPKAIEVQKMGLERAGMMLRLIRDRLDQLEGDKLAVKMRSDRSTSSPTSIQVNQSSNQTTTSSKGKKRPFATTTTTTTTDDVIQNKKIVKHSLSSSSSQQQQQREQHGKRRSMRILSNRSS